jgi:hypothetical protein
MMRWMSRQMGGVLPNAQVRTERPQPQVGWYG